MVENSKCLRINILNDKKTFKNIFVINSDEFIYEIVKNINKLKYRCFFDEVKKETNKNKNRSTVSVEEY